MIINQSQNRQSSEKAWQVLNTASLVRRIAVVTGASSGIGRSMATELARAGANVCAVGRNPAALAETVEAVQQFSQGTAFETDLTSQKDLEPLIQRLEQAGKLDILIHCAGIMLPNQMECSRIEDLDSQYAVNVRAPYLLTQRLLPLLIAAHGQIVFINSSAGLAARRADLGQYSATKHALKAIADSLREELNPKGVRVLSVYLGRTATPMQKARFHQEGKPYRPELLMQAEDVATMVIHALCLPRTAEATDISMRPMCKSY